MEDTISRCSAIDAILKEANKDGTYGYIDAKTAVDVLNGLPEEEPEWTMGDLIVRGDAIDAMTDDNIIRNMDSVYDCALRRIKRSMTRILAGLPSAQFKRIKKGIHEITNSDKISYAVICDKFPSPHIYFNTYKEAERWARFDQPNDRPYYIVERSEHFEIVGEVR